MTCRILTRASPYPELGCPNSDISAHPEQGCLNRDTSSHTEQGCLSLGICAPHSQGLSVYLLLFCMLSDMVPPKVVHYRHIVLRRPIKLFRRHHLGECKDKDICKCNCTLIVYAINTAETVSERNSSNSINGLLISFEDCYLFLLYKQC